MLRWLQDKSSLAFWFMIARSKWPNAIVSKRLYFVQSVALTMDDTILDIDQIENLIKFCPTKEEMELLKVQMKFLIYMVFFFFLKN